MKAPWIRTAAPGLLLGFTVSRLGFGDYDELHRMLLFKDLRLLLAFALAVSLAIAAFALIKGRLNLPTLKVHKGTIPGAVLFGIGWAITGACPGVALIQLGQGRWPALASLGGILAGLWIADRTRKTTT